MMLERRTRGQPLLALALVLAGWVGARAMAWEHALDRASADVAEAAALRLAADRDGTPVPGHARAGHRPAPAARAAVPAAAFAALPPPPWATVPQVAVPPRALPLEPVPFAAPTALAPAATSTPLPAEPGRRIAMAGGHQSLWLAATALIAFPPLGTGSVTPAAPAGTLPARRWSADGWLLLRRSDNTIVPGPNPGTYGASQVGAVIRYRLAPADPHRTSLYGRAYGALNGTREQQAALGLSARPIAALPLTAMAEGRLARDSSGVRLRPAVAVITELPPQSLPFGFTGEVYGQAGWVGGRKPTGFVEGLARAERPLAAPVDGFRLSAGAGAWAAKQRGASRVDVGPVASMTVRLTDTASARMEADWRFRVAGRSRPGSGPALTLSTGF
jgi:hypothetical protein